MSELSLEERLDWLHTIATGLYKHLSSDFCWHCGCEAADEIERLREDKEHWFHLARRLFDLIPETSSETLHRANVLRLCEESLQNEFEKGLSHE